MTTPSFRKLLPAALAATSLAGCGFIKVNGKPLGGGAGPGGASASNGASATGASGGNGSSGAGSNDAGGSSSASVATSGARPAWCDEYQYSTSTSYSMAWFAGMDDEALRTNARMGDVFGEVVCAREFDKPADRAPLLALRARWMTMMGYDERDMQVLAGAPKGYGDSAQPLDTLGGVMAQYDDHVTLANLDRLGNHAPALITALTITHCLGAENGSLDEITNTPLLSLILCMGDEVDVAQANAEIDQIPNLNGVTRLSLRGQVHLAAEASTKAQAALAALAAQEPGVHKLLTIAAAEWKTWTAPSGERAALVKQLEAMEAATASNKRSAFAGCDAITRDAWAKQLAHAKLPKVPDHRAFDVFADAILTGPEAYLAYQALRLCAAGLGDGGALPGEVGASLTWRGPRSATLARWARGAGDIAFDDRRLSMGGLLGETGLGGGGDWSEEHKGEIGAIANHGGKVEISFKKVVKPIETCTNWHETSRIDHITDTGQLVYRQECLGWGKVMTDLTAAPVEASPVLAAGLSPGMYLVAVDGLPIVATRGTDDAKPIWVLGAKLDR